MSKRLFLLFAILTVSFYNVKSEDAFYPQPAIFTQDNNFFLHTIERGQTAYSIAIMYNVSVEDIYLLNPGSKKGIRAGDVLKIPQESSSYLYHTIQPQETLYSLAKIYHMKGEDIIAANPGLSVKTFIIGKIIRIPTNMVTTPMQGGNETITNSLLSKNNPLPSEVNTVKVALLLPFGTDDSTVQKSVQNRMVEYYEGFLLSFEDLKKDGISINLQTYDIGSGANKITAILKKKEMKDIDLLIGGLYDEQIKLLSRFAKENNIPYVIPFTSLSNEPMNNPDAYQINTPQSYLYSKASQAFISKYGKDCNVVIVSDETDASNKKEFIETLKQDLQDKNISYKTVVQGANFYNDVMASLNRDQTNVIVPSDDSVETLSKMIATLRSIIDSQPNLSLALFGYPGWQAQSAKYSSDFFSLNATFYTLFYVDPTSQDTKDFYSTFYKWYTRVLDNNFPKYGMLGYDMGMYFIRLIHTYGSPFYSHINDLKYNGIQTDFYFERVNNWGGFINTNMYLINYNPDYSITKSPVK